MTNYRAFRAGLLRPNGEPTSPATFSAARDRCEKAGEEHRYEKSR